MLWLLCSLLSLTLIITRLFLGLRGFYWSCFYISGHREPTRATLESPARDTPVTECKTQHKLPAQLWPLQGEPGVTHFPLQWDVPHVPEQSWPITFPLGNTGRLVWDLAVAITEGTVQLELHFSSRIIFSGIFWTRFCLFVAKQAFYTQFMNLHGLSLIILRTCRKVNTFL